MDRYSSHLSSERLGSELGVVCVDQRLGDDESDDDGMTVVVK